MTNFRTQLEALGSALLLIQKLPDGTVWALTITNDDDAECPSVLNVYIEREHWTKYINLLSLGRAIDTSESFMSWRQGTLLVSLINPEVNDER